MTDAFDDFLPVPRHPDSKRRLLSKTNPYSHDDEPYLALEDGEQFDVVDRRSFAEEEVVRIDELAEVKGKLEGFGHRLTHAGTPRVRRTLKVPLNPEDVPASLLERLYS